MGSAVSAPRRVLVVEDQTLLGNYIGDLLADLGCEAVGPFCSVATAVPAALREPLDAALLDVYLADERVEPLAEILERRGIPFAFVTAYGRDHLPAEMQTRPCLNKPFTDGEIGALVAGLLGGHPPPARKSASLSLQETAQIARKAARRRSLTLTLDYARDRGSKNHHKGTRTRRRTKNGFDWTEASLPVVQSISSCSSWHCGGFSLIAAPG